MNVRNASPEAGFALLALMGVIGVTAIGLLLVVQPFVPTLRERATSTDENLRVAVDAAKAAFRSDGAFPADLDALAAAVALDPDGGWRHDPYGSGEDLDLRTVASGLQLRSRGPDGRLGTADDVTFGVSGETALRGRQRMRLRLLRAVFTRSPYRHADTMSPAEEVAMAAAMRDHARARRRWLGADATERASLTDDLAAAEGTITTLRDAHALPALPGAPTGAGGLASMLGVQDWRVVDGRGAALLLDPVLGFVAVGWDGTGGTDDDM